MKFVILTGMSGAGKSTALKMMEDIGFYCVDNLPIPLLEKFVELSNMQQNAELQKVAVGIDIRSGEALRELRSVLDHVRGGGAGRVEHDADGLVRQPGFLHQLLGGFDVLLVV